jgi:UDP-GlcNAc3NAcA epimerase
MALERSARVIVTDSGGMQKEAFFYRVPCVTIRDETEWTETVELGWNTVVGADLSRIVEAVRESRPSNDTVSAPYGAGNASRDVIEIMLSQ